MTTPSDSDPDRVAKLLAARRQAPPGGGPSKPPSRPARGRTAGRSRKPTPPTRESLADLLDVVQQVPAPAPTLATMLDPFAGMNPGERKFADYLAGKKGRGEILHWAFEPITLKLAPSTRYTPDFLIVLPDRSIALYDVKGRKGESFWAEEDAWLKLKLAAALHPFPLYVVWPLKGGAGWGVEWVGPNAVRAGEGRLA